MDISLVFIRMAVASNLFEGNVKFAYMTKDSNLKACR
jgi:hypothetical protein